MYDDLLSEAPSQVLPVFSGRDFIVMSGANLGDGLAEADQLILDDVYWLRPGAERLRLVLAEGDGERRFRIAAGSQAGRVGAEVVLDSALTFMSPDGLASDVLVFVELTEARMVAAIWMLPLSALAIRHDHALVAIDRVGVRAKLAEIACVSFVRGTHITMANGLQKPIEELQVGDRVLTRDNGPQPVRWIGQQTVRAAGALAPITIAKGAMNNSGDLTLSPNHRLFVYQRRDKLKAGRSEVLVRVRNLVNGETVQRSDGGYVEYFQLLFDRHEIIYAEGIAAESLFVDTRVRAVIPPELHRELLAETGGAADRIAELELDAEMLDAANAADLLRAASGA